MKASRTRQEGFTLVEVLVSMLVAGIMIVGLISGFIQSHRQAEWSAYSLAAQSLAMQTLEQGRAAKWDPYSTPPVDQLVASNFPVRVEVLDIPISRTNIVYATNRTTIQTITVTPPLKQIAVECTWSFHNRGAFTNSIVTYRAADQ